uniref:Uncharacterized protein n=1 Tax=Anopheles atroparvus TaxID=41427 RepID=A0A182JHW3_ANOAO
MTKRRETFWISPSRHRGLPGAPPSSESPRRTVAVRAESASATPDVHGVFEVAPAPSAAACGGSDGGGDVATRTTGAFLTMTSDPHRQPWRHPTTPTLSQSTPGFPPGCDYGDVDGSP